jgi:hypothetical protein
MFTWKFIATQIVIPLLFIFFIAIDAWIMAIVLAPSTLQALVSWYDIIMSKK